MHIVFAASECVPFVKTGGLADVIGALPAELVRQGHAVTVYLPLFRAVSTQLTAKRQILIQSLTIPFSDYNRFVSVVDGGTRDGVRFLFIDCPELFDREALYGTAAGDYPDNWERFALFCRAVLESSKQLGVPDVFHAHDWQAAMLPVYLHTVYAQDPALARCGSVFTIHNAGYQGWFSPQTTERLLLPWDLYRMDRLEQYDTFNFLKGGLVFADALTTVSRKYAEEIQTAEFGYALEATFRRRAADLHGILNGVDYDQWDPSHDRFIAAHYGPANLAGKAQCRRDLLHAFDAPDLPETTPVLGIVSRFATQKGFDLLAEIAERLAERELFLVALGTGEPFYENLLRSLQERFPHRFAVRVQYDNTLAHKIEAGADMFLMPSRYEPCGLNQIYSLRYGTVPVVRATGGLDDTVAETVNPGEGTGFKFHSYEAADFLHAIDRALGCFADQASWQQMMLRGMAVDYSWKQPAAEYIALYESVVRRRS
ncbi:glycogen synthase GlgA [Acidipila sp. EB88]|nr:glycogen synthase GlgA [Acidipila sp. EB88]RRA49706.1 glycogen synthase GlgA [Acidipila sp. EB88]